MSSLRMIQRCLMMVFSRALAIMCSRAVKDLRRLSLLMMKAQKTRLRRKEGAGTEICQIDSTTGKKKAKDGQDKGDKKA